MRWRYSPTYSSRDRPPKLWPNGGSKYPHLRPTGPLRRLFKRARQPTNKGSNRFSFRPPIFAPPKPPGPNVPGSPDSHTKCKPVWFTITGVGPHQALQGAAGFHPPLGSAAYHPADFGLTNAQAKALDRSTAIIFQPDWSQAKIPAPNGGYASPTARTPQIPIGLPSEARDSISGMDTVSPPVPHHLDVYRYPTQAQGMAAKRVVPVITYIPRNTGAKCSK
jgi:hypothetical protein